MTAAVLSPGGVFKDKTKIKKGGRFQPLPCSPCPHPFECVESHRPRYGIQLVGELAPFSGCSMAKGVRAPTPHRTTSRAVAPMDMVHVNTVGPFTESLGSSRDVAIFVDSASHI